MLKRPMTEEEYTNLFAFWNAILSVICPDLPNDFLVARVEREKGCPNFVITASLCEGNVPTDETMIGDPYIKIISAEYVTGLAESMNAEIQEEAA